MSTARAEPISHPRVSLSPSSPLRRLLLPVWRPGSAHVLVALVIVWQLVVTLTNPPEALLPAPLVVFQSLAASVVDGSIPNAASWSLRWIVEGLGVGLVFALGLAVAALFSRMGKLLMLTLVGTFNPLPAIAVLPLALLWFGIGPGAIVFVIVMSVTWSVALNFYTGFSTVPLALQRVGRNFGLSGLRLVVEIFIPAALPHLLSGIRIGWAYAWRTAIAAELVFGAGGGQGGLGWLIYSSRYYLDTAETFAGLITIIIIGVVVDKALFGSVEAFTVRKWGTVA